MTDDHTTHPRDSPGDSPSSTDRWPVAYDATPGAAPCLRCRNRLTWAERRHQYGRARQRGLTHEQVIAITPRCQKCMTRYLRENPLPPVGNPLAASPSPPLGGGSDRAEE